MKLWIDECLSPTLVARANRRGYWATCNRDRDLLGVHDDALHKIVIGEEAVFVTNNEADFVALYRRVDLHTGLLILRWESLPSDDPACPPVPCSGLMKEILGKLMGL